MGQGGSKLSAEQLGELQRLTALTRRQLQAWHKLFLAEHPSGLITRADVALIYERFFPFGDSAAFAAHMFRLYSSPAALPPAGGAPAGRRRPPGIPFEAFVRISAAILHCTPPPPPESAAGDAPAAEGASRQSEERLRIAFALFDCDEDGRISRTDMLAIVDAIHRMTASAVLPAAAEEGALFPSQRVSLIFGRFAKARRLPAARLRGLTRNAPLGKGRHVPLL